MLKVRFTRIKNTVVMEVLEQSINDSKHLDFKASNGFDLEKCDEPEIYASNRIFLRGSDHTMDYHSCSKDFENEVKAINFIMEAEKAIKEFNSLYSEAETVDNENHIVTTIAQ